MMRPTKSHENGDLTDNGNGPTILALEIEPADDDEEQESLIQETMDMEPAMMKDGIMKDKLFLGRNAHGMRHRSVDHQNGYGNGGGYGTDVMNQGVAYIRGFLRSDLMSHAVYHLRNFLLFALLAVFVLIVLEWEGSMLKHEQMEDVEPPHEFSYGGKNNLGHNTDNKPKKPLQATSSMTAEEYHKHILDEEADYRGPWDLSIVNLENENAHYMHDPIQSPFASSNYAANQAELDRRQAVFTDKMENISQEFGVWNNPNFENAVNPSEEFYDYFDYRDVPVEDFPDYAWQKDKLYIENFINQASALVEGVKEGIMIEYGHENPGNLEKDLFGVIIGDHDVEDGTAVHTDTGEKRAGIAYLPQSGWDGLVKKLLHAMITTDFFYVVCVGRADTYKANNFWQTQVMQFNHVMEPVFHKLGMTLISRNMGMGASTAFSSLGGADIYGETDILWHFQAHDEEEKPGEYDLLQKQSILAGERVPLIISPISDELVSSSRGKAWVGNLQPGADMCQETTLQVLPETPACHNVRCDDDTHADGKCFVYDSVCWVPRSGWNPEEEDQDKNVGDQGRGFPGFRKHQLEGRKMSLMILHALGAALKLWREKMKDDNIALPLPTEHWHVGDSYKEIREAMMDLKRTPGESISAPSCEVLMKDIDPRICNLPMHAYTEWTPRIKPRTSRLSHIANNPILGESESEKADAYEGPDVIPVQWQIPVDQMDVHMIAIATNKTDDLNGDLFVDEVWNDDDVYGGEGFGRNLQLVDKVESTRSNHRELRRLQNGQPVIASTGITEGSGWRLIGAPIGYCDGSAQSRCNRRISNSCLLANHNHYKADLVGKPSNGWLVMRIEDLRHGIVLARLQFMPSSPGRSLPNDLVFEYAINDGEVVSVKASELASFGKEVVKFLTVYPLLLDQGYAPFDIYPDGKHCDVAIRILSKSDPDCEVRLSHLYYA